MNQTETRLHESPEQASQIIVTVLYFARLREAFGRNSEQVALPAGRQTVASLRACLRSRAGPWDAELAPEKPVRVAVNQDMAQGETPLTEGDEVAFFPPVTGG